MEQLANEQEVAEVMYDYVKRAHGLKKVSPGEVIKAAERFFGERASKKTCKQAIRVLVDSGKCIYTYFGSTAIEIPTDDESSRS